MEKQKGRNNNGRKSTAAVLPEPQVMSGLTIKELEMVPKLEQIARLNSIPVGGDTSINDDVIGSIASQATREVEGVAEVGDSSLRRSLAERVGGAKRRARGVEVEAGARHAIVDITVRVVYGYSIPHTIVEIRRNVADRVLKLCGLVAKEINVRVSGLEFPAKTPRKLQ